MLGSGAGSGLPTPILTLTGVSTLVAVLVSTTSIYFHLKNYRKPILQRMVVRIMLMVPIYGISSLIAIFSLEAAFVIDAVRDIYEAFVIYCFFSLLLSYLGGERSLLILLHGRPPKDHVFPVSIFKREIDVSDPHTFLFLKRGIMQYVQVKPVLAVITLILKACGKFNEGDFRANSGYLYVSIIYNTSICLSLYCLAVFWLCINDDLKAFRPIPKFLCVKGILFFSFWQSIGISALVATGAIKKLGPYTDAEHISLGLTDTLICLEMPFFAFAHMYAFSHTDYIDPKSSFVARMPMYYAFRDAFGLLDVVEDSKATLRGEGMDYREFEPAEGFVHQGEGRDRRIRAGLRYSKGGRRKYWLPRPAMDTQGAGVLDRGVNQVINRVAGWDQGGGVYAPLFSPEAEDVVHLAPDLVDPHTEPNLWDSSADDSGYDLPFGDLDDDDEELYKHSKKYLFGDYHYPCIDVSSEAARVSIWDEEERVLRDERSAWYSPLGGAKGQVTPERRDGMWEGYGAVGTTQTGYRGGGNEQYHELGHENSRVIDHEENRVSSAEPGDVKLRWTKMFKGQGTTPTSRSEPPLQSRLTLASSGESSRSSNLPHSSSHLRNNYHTHGGAKSSPLPPDAVDLVVEDRDAGLEEQTRERRKGEPSIRGSGLRKVYRPGFVAVSDNDPPSKGGIVEVEEPDGEALEAEREDLSKDAYSGSDAEEIIVRAETPPWHARPAVPGYDESNPWA